MGSARFVIDDPTARFGREIPKRKADPLRLHLALSPAGSRQLSDAALAASQREKSSAIECACGVDDRDRSRRGKYLAYLALRIEIRASDDSDPTFFDEAGDLPTLRWNRRELPKLFEICELLLAGEFDRRVAMRDDLHLWIWGGGARF